MSEKTKEQETESRPALTLKIKKVRKQLRTALSAGTDGAAHPSVVTASYCSS